jgi:cytochrome c-type biogenesis protein CcmF
MAGLRRTLALPTAFAALVLLVCGVLTDAAQSVPALIMFGLAAWVLAVVAQEFARGTSARRSMTGEAAPQALAGLVRRNRRRYGGYMVHAGMAVLFLGVAGSSAFHQQRDVRLSPGQSFRTGDYKITYVKPTARLGTDPSSTGAPLSFGAVLRVQNGNRVQTIQPARNFYPTLDPTKGAIGRYFEGEATSEVHVDWGLRRDFWAAMRPDISNLDGPIRVANRKFGNAGPDVQGFVIAAIAQRYRNHAPPATFRTIVSPLVSWIWIGGGIVLLGALVAAWPSPEARLRRVRSLYAARLGKELAGGST